MKKLSRKILLLLALFATLLPAQDKANQSSGDLPKAKSITLLSPNGGETWKIGTTHTIRWTSSEVQFVRIDLSSTGGTSWKTIVSSTTASVGQYDWTISSSLYSPTTEARIRVYDITDGSVLAQSAANFTISQLDVTSPTSANKLQVGDNFDISWIASNDISTLKIEYTSNGLIWNNISASEAATASPFTWNVPDDPSSIAQIRLTDLANSVNVAYSDIFSIASLSLTSPNGGEDWFSGTNQAITWTSTNVSSVKIEYSTDNGLTWTTIENAYDAGAGSYSWNVPFTPTDEAMLRISDASYSNVNDQSDNKFTISSIRVDTPNGGEGWTIGSSKTITWSSNIAGNLKIELSTDGGATFSNVLVNSVAATAASSTITVPNAPTQQARIKISSVNDPTKYDISDVDFTIGTVTVTTPAGGEVWQSSTVNAIEWTSSGLDVVAIEYSLDGTTWNSITSSTSAATGSYNWSIPSSLSGNSITIRIRDAETGTDILSTSNPFSITGLRLTSPSGGEAWESGSTQNITWTASSSINNITIQYSTDNGTTWNNIATGVTASDGTYSWSIPGSLSSSQMRVRIVNEDNSSIFSMNSQFFRIGNIGLSTPNGGETLLAGGTYNITWSNSTSVEFVRIQYSTNGGTSFINIANAVDASLGSYTWNIPDVTTSNGRIRISDTFGPTIDDTSSADFTIARLQVTSPNGGEGYSPGSTQTITWNSSSINDVKIEFSLDGGSTWSTIVGSISAASGSYSWTVPTAPTSSGLIKISSVDNPNFYDVSDANFKIASLVVTSPNGGENYQTGSSQTISWSASSNISSVNIDLSTDNGLNWINLSTGYNAAQDFSWTVGNNPSSQALIRVTDASNNNIKDESDAIFAIELLQVTSPNGGEFFLVDSTVNITWNSNSVNNVKLEYSTNNGLVWQNIIASTPAAPQSYSWTVPNTPSADVIVRISDADNASAVITDNSDTTFTISTLYLKSPNGGESFSVNTQQTILWSAHSSVNSVTLEYTTNNGTSWNTISSSVTASDQSYQWTIPNATTNQALVRITDNNNTSVSDQSDGLFSIGSMSLTSPNGGERWQVGSTHKITWNNISSVLQVNIEYSTDNGNSWTSIATNISASLESYDWTIPNSLTSLALVRVKDASDATINDISDAVFTIADLNVTAPNGNEALQVGGSYAITWTASNIPQIDIEYSSDNGSTWTTISTGIDASLGNYQWTLPSTATSTGLIRITDSQISTISDQSDQTFSLISLDLTSPDGGEGWTIGDTKSITWTHGGVATIKLEYSTDNGTTWNTIIDNIDANDLSYNWTIPNSPSSDYLVRIIDEARTNISDQSAAIFTVGSIVVTKPVGTDNWKSGTTNEITWTATDGLNTVNLEYSTDNGSNWTSIATSIPASTQSYFWTIPGNISSSTAKIRVSHGITASEISDESSVFTINSLQLIKPNGGDFFQAGTTERIEWSSSVVNSLTIEYSTNNGTSWSTIANNYPASNGVYNWSVPANISSKVAKVRIKDANNTNILDSSSAVFTIGSITVTSPATDSVWKSNNTYTIKWNASSSVDLVRLDYSTDLGTSWNVISTSITGLLGQYDWTIPANISSNQVQIRASDALSSLAISDISDVFTIMFLDVVSPNGGENWQTGSTQTISWNASSLISNVNLYYSSDNGANWNSIATNLNASDGSYNWTLPMGIASSNMLIKIENSSNSSISDISDAVFTASEILLTSPTSSSVLQTGSTFEITWNSTNLTNVKLEYSLDNQTTWSTIVNSVAASLGSYTWNIPSGTATNQGVIRISPTSDASIQDTAGLFVIKQLDLTAPVGGEIWQTGSTQNITWNSSQVSQLNIYYSTNNGSTWSTIVSNTNAATGSYAWSIPNNISTSNALVKIEDATNTSISDSSASTFSIGSLAITSPVSGDEWQSDRTYTIKWTFTDIQNVRIEYSIDNGSVWKEIVASVAASLGQYDWNIPAGISSNQALIRITSIEKASLTATSNIFTIKRLDLTQPNGGEIVQSGANYSITWNSSQVGTIDLYYSANNGQVWNSIVTGVNASLGSYLWAVPPDVTSSNALIRLIDAGNSSIRDSSSSTFTIGSLAITSPVNTDQWQAGTTHDITWTESGLQNVKLEYSSDNGSNWNEIIASVAANLGSYSWTIPSNLSTAQAKVRITAVEDNSIKSESSVFTIKLLSLASPNGGELFQSGSNQTISWSAGQISTLDIYYSTDQGQSWNTIITGYNASLGTFNWSIPSNVTTTQGLVRLIDSNNSSVRDSSDNVFSIGSLSLTAPSGGEVWQSNTTNSITWNSTGIDNVKLEYSLDNGANWSTISSSVNAANGSYDWTIPSGLSSNLALVRISAVSDASIMDQSNNFTIKQLDLTSPIGGEYLLSGTSTSITWSSGQVNQVNIYYSIDNGSTFRVIIENQNATTGTYTWNIPDTLTSSQAIIRIVDVDNSTVRDQSDNLFTIGLLSITNPSGGEEWQTGSTQKIQWNASNTGNLTLEYSLDGNAWTTIASNVDPANGFYDWLIPTGISSSAAQVRVTSVLSNNIRDVSAAFKLKELNITSPNGGENWLAGSIQQITWNSGAVNGINIYLSKDNGTTWNAIKLNQNASSGSFSWNIPDTIATSEALIKIEDAGNSAIKDSSNNVFTINTLMLTSPSGGEKFQEGADVNIVWLGSSTFNQVKLEYSIDGGINWSTIVSSAPASDNGYTWTIPAGTATNKARVRVSDLPSANFVSSSSDFTIAKLQLTSPNGSDYLQAGTTSNITWQSSFINNVDIEYSSDGGANWNSIVTNYSAASQTYAWNIPANLSSNQMLVRISDSQQNTITDQSNAQFTVGDVQVVFPNNGELLNAGKTYTIQWTNSSSVSNVKIELSTDNGSNWVPIVDNTPADGSYDWAISSTITSDKCLIRISDAQSNLSISDVSDNVFVIDALILTSPNGGESFQIGSTQAITWQSVSSITNVKLEFSVDGGGWNLIANNVAANLGTYNWTIPNSPSDSVLVRVSDPNNSSFSDISSSSFRISDVRLTQPNGGEKWQAGSSKNIIWTNTVNVDSVDLFYTTSGTNWQFISRRNASDGSYTWTLPNTTSTQYSVQIVDVSSGSAVNDTADSRFIVSDVNINQPTGGESVLAGSTLIIKWNNSSDIDSLELRYSLDNGASWNGIATVQGNQTQYSWKIPQGISSNNAKISLRDYNFTTIGDTTAPFIITSSSIVVTQPNGGEFIPAGSQYTIQWTADNSISNVGIDLSTDGGSSWSTLVGSISASAGQYNWNVSPSLATSNALIKVYDVLNTFIADSSDLIFTIGGLSLIAPDGGEHWQGGSAQTIQWTASPNVTNIKIEYSSDGGSNWQTIESSYPAAGGTYTWNIPNISSNNALIRISDITSSNQINDVSSSSFIISLLTLTAPNGGEDLQLGSTYNISWVNSSDITQVILEYSADGVSWSAITSQPIDASTGSYTWNLTGLNCSSTNFVRVKDFAFPSTIDASDASFTIKQLDIASPGGGENWQAGSTQTISWDYCNINKVIIEYSVNDGTTWNKIDTVNAANLTYSWTVTNDTSKTARIRLRDLDNASILAVSNRFTVFTPTISLISPNGGEHYQAKDVRQIKWTGLWLNTIKIEYSLDNGVNWNLLENSYPAASGVYNWLLPDTVTSQALVKISDTQNPSLVDSSASTFKISKLSLLSPLGGEFWTSGSTQKIKWSASNTINNVKLQYTLDGQTYTTIPGANALVASTGSFDWNISQNISSANAKILVTAIEGDSIDAVSPEVFKIGWIVASQPAGGEILHAGKTFPITWTKSSSVTNLKLDLLDESTGVIKNIGSVGDTTSFLWTVTNDITTDSARIIISDEGSSYQISDTTQRFSIRTLRITLPDNTTNWMAGTTQQIQWAASPQIDSVRIEFSTDAGSTWNPVTPSNVPASPASYSWNIPSTISSSNCMIKINDVANSDIVDTTSTFTIYIPSLTLTSPNGGDYLIAGSVVPIKWEAGFVTSITIEFSPDNGATWTTLVSPYNASNGFYNWTIPSDLSTTEGLIRITDFSDNNNTDVSDAVFKIGWIKITSPSQGERFRAGLSANINWQVSNSVAGVDLYYIMAQDTIPIATNQLASAGSYAWNNLPSVSTDSIKVIVFDSESNRKLYAATDYFSISILNVDSPNGGEFLSSGTTSKIKWTASSNISRLKIRLYTPELGWNIIVPTTVSSAGSFDWNIPATLVSDSAKIEISDVQYPNVADTSDAVFRVGSLQLLSLKNSEKIRENSSYKIQWSASSNIKFVEISYKIAKGNSWTPIVITQADSSYDWIVPQTPSNDCYIRIRDVNNTSLLDTNTSAFTIARLRITSPVGGEYLQAGVDRNYTIELERQFIDNIRLEYTKDYTANPVKWENISIPNGTGTSYIWNEIENLGLSDAGNNYKIRVYDLNYPEVGDTVDKPIVVSYLRLINPNGGTGEQIGTQYNVEWIASSNTISTVNLAVKGSGDPNYGVPLNANPLNAADLKYIWNINIDPDPGVSMKIYDPEHPEIYDLSDSTFIISRIQLVTPDGGERWQIGKKYPVEWKSDFIDQVILQYNLTGNDADWQNIQNAGFQNSSAGGGIYEWTLDDGIVFATDKAKVRVVSSDFQNIRDTSKSTFTIVRLEVTSPQSREAWNTGSTHQISWISEKLDSVRIFVDLGDGTAPIPVAGPISATNDNPYSWTIPTGITTSKARIIVRDYRDASIADTSKTEFVIGPSPVVRVRDKYQGGTVKFTWSFDTPGEVLTVIGLQWRFSGTTTYSPGGSGLTISQSTFTGPVIEDTLKWNSKAFVDNFEGFVDIKVLYQSDFNVNYEVPLDSVKIDNKPPEYDDNTFVITQRVFSQGWDKAVAKWTAAIDSSKPVTVSFVSSSTAINGVSTTRDSMVLRDLTTATNYDFDIIVSDALGNSRTYQHSFTTLNLADYNGDKAIDVVDLSAFVTSWSSPDSIHGADFYPYTGEIPYVEVNGNFELDMNDLLTFIDIWYYDKINVSLPKLANKSFGDSDERKEIRFKRGEKKFEFPISLSDNNDIKAFSVRLSYDNAVFDLDSITITGKSISPEDISLIYVDSLNGMIYADFAKIKGKANGEYLLTASVNSNLNKFNPKDSLLLEITGVDNKSETVFKKSIVYTLTEIPKTYTLSQNYPNPFNPSTTIEYELPEPARVQLVLYNILGQKVAVLIDGMKKEGSYKYLFDASKINGGLATGVYIYRFVANNFVSTKKLLLLK